MRLHWHTYTNDDDDYDVHDASYDGDGHDDAGGVSGLRLSVVVAIDYDDDG